jgi:hypothetical protein
VPKPSAFETDLAAENLKTHKSPGTDHIPAEVIKAGGRTIHSEIHKLINSIWNKEELPRSGRSRSLYLSIRKVKKQFAVIIEAYHFRHLRTKFYPTSCSQGSLHMWRKLLGIISVDFDTTCQLLTI